MKVLFKFYWTTILWALFIFIMCIIKLGKISNSHLFFRGFDKLVHCVFLFVLVVSSSAGLIRQQSHRNLSYKYVLLFTVAAIVYGGFIEVLQSYIFTWRSGEWNDLFADTVGALMGAFSVIVTLSAMSYVKK